MGSDKTTEEGLKRVVGISGFSLNIINFTIGAGIFALPAMVGVVLGAYAIFAYIFCGLMLASIMLCYAEIGSKVTSSGGSYAYVEAAFGKFAGFIINWLFFVLWGIVADAALMNVVADSLEPLFPAFSNLYIRASLFFVLLLFMVLVNVRGSRLGVSFIKWITIIKILPLIGIIILGIPQISTVNLHLHQPPSFSAFSSTLLILFFAFAGFETALGMSGEIKNPRRTIPTGIFWGALVIIIMYLCLQTVTQGVLGNQMASVKDAPLAAVAFKIVGSEGGIILLVAAAVSCFGAVFGDVLNTPRVLFAGANDGMFPKFLGKLHPKFATPYFAIITYASLIFIFTVSGGFKQLAILASTAILLIYLSVIFATLKLRRAEQIVPEGAFSMPGGLLFPVIGIASIIGVLSSLRVKEVLFTLVFIALVSILFFVIRKVQKRTGLLKG
ncbi:MAG: amino acid permease [Chitinophagaceae bacterium]|nr:amino acid permease [Bacteroidota bacterium]MCC6257118.1 amino acid permease [Chitinophagaceae bacterium]MCW5916267.1 amino acid permease [Ferruginibacter sp.]